MRVESAASAKETRHGVHNQHQIPAGGSVARRVYDLLMQNKGIPIDVSLTAIAAGSRKSHGRVLEDLRDFYGLDIRRIQNRRWVLAGEWFGKDYRDYIAEHLEKLEVAR